MQLFHGSLSSVVVLNFKLLNNKTDFGKGFYTTTDYDQSVKWTFVKKSRINSDKLIFRYGISSKNMSIIININH